MSTGPAGPAGSIFDPEVEAQNEYQINALKAIFGMGTAALAAGAGARSMSGMGNFFNRNLGSGGTRTPMRQSFVRIPVPVKVRTPEERDAILAATGEDNEKDAGLVKLAKLADDWWTSLGTGLGLTRVPGQQESLPEQAVGGWGYPSIYQKPWAYPAAGLAIGGGLYGGWKLTDYLLDKTKNMEQESELEEARKDYESALASRRKTAAVQDKPGPIDTLAVLYEKRAWWQEGAGLGLLGMGAIAAGSGIGTYNWTRSIAEDKAIEEAVKQRQAQIAEQAPSPIMALPTPVPILSPQRSHWHHMMGHAPEKEKKEKAASIGQAADQFLNRIRSNQMAVWQRLMTPTDAKPAKPEKPAEPAPPQLPTLAGAQSRMASPQAT